MLSEYFAIQEIRNNPAALDNPEYSALFNAYAHVYGADAAADLLPVSDLGLRL